MSRFNENNLSNSNTCVVCYKDGEYFSIGLCEHAVCFECSTRMRVLCEQNECPICRQDLPKVVFTKEIKPYRLLKKGPLVDAKYNIHFECPEIQRKFQKLLSHNCYICNKKEGFNSFESLKEHMKKKHDLYYCDLCAENVKIFPHERRCYNQSDLKHHMSKGDLDDKSHKGHPLCKFCVKRYMDNDDLFRHLRREHLFCHFCDADGLHQYYQSYNDLRSHYKSKHYLCEEAACIDEEFTSVFRSEIDLKAHKANVHAKGLSKAAAKQARTLELEFNYGQLRSDTRMRRQNGNRFDNSSNQHQEPVEEEPTLEYFATPTQIQPDVQSTAEFPSLGGASAPTLLSGPVRSKGGLNLRSKLKPGNYDLNFPTLGAEAASASASPSASASTLATTSKNSRTSITSAPVNGLKKTFNMSVNTNTSGKVMGAIANQRPKETVKPTTKGPPRSPIPTIVPKPSSSRDSRDVDFPALGGTSSASSSVYSAGSQSTQSWTKVTCSKQYPVQKKVQTQSIPPIPPPIKSSNDFPSLSKTNARQPIPGWVQAPDSDSTKGKAKKKKKQQNKNAISYSTLASGSKNNSTSQSTSNTGENIKVNNTNDSSCFGANTPAHPVTVKQQQITKSKNNSQENKPPNKISQDDFPSLTNIRNAPSGPPPGFTTQSISSAPPGFNSKPNGFTKNLDDRLSIDDLLLTKAPADYINPQNFQERNRQLIKELSIHSQEFEDFKYISALFRNNQCLAADYYKKCRSVMNPDLFDNIFSELLALLPDINKQRELYMAYILENNGKGIKGLTMCPSCGQILCNRDLHAHMSSHNLDDNFPCLGMTMKK
ncbi:hypothetical protein TKK_0015931 [Trichogramma kaykai]|uniref:RING-type E3 ubiquitin transferase n=1 Tax=Trichogramma kaykai TaxID=54128 RepID=A0ABD2W927_9HYME